MTRRYGLDIRDATVCLFGFEEDEADVRPVDATGNVADLAGNTGLGYELPPLVSSDRGLGRAFANAKGAEALEAVADSLLLRHNVTIRAVFKYGIDNALDNEVSTVIQRGAGATDPERRLFGLEVQRLSAATIQLRMRWDEWTGGGYDDVPDLDTLAVPYAGGEIVVAAVREWVSQDVANIRFFINGEIVGSQTVNDAFIREGSGGTLFVGSYSATQYWPDGSYIAEVAVESDAMTAEEIRQEYRRMLIHQPAGQAMIRANLPPGTTYAPDPGSLVQKAIAADGDAIGQIIALGEQMREDWSPDRAYGSHLEHWERLVGATPKPNDTVAARRTAVLGLLRKAQGFPLADIKEALEPLFDVAAVDIEIVEFTGLRTDDFSTDDITTPPSSMWVTKPGNGAIAIVGGPNLRFVGTAATQMEMVNGAAARREVSLSARKGQDVDGATLMCNINTLVFPTTEDLVYGHIWRDIAGNAVIIGKRWDTFNSYEHVVGYEYNALSGVLSSLFEVDPGAAIDPQYLLTRYDQAGQLYYEHAATSGAILGHGGATQAVSLSSPRWAGLCIVGTDAALGSGATVYFSDFRVFEPRTPRGFAWIAYRDPADPGVPKIDAAQAQLNKQKPAHTLAHAATHKQGMLAGTGRAGNDPTMPTLT